MERDQFFETVEQRADLADRDDARDAARAVLSTVGERLGETLSQNLSSQLPEELSDHLTDGASGQRFSYEEFLSRVEQRADRADTGDPEQLATAVTATLLEGVNPEERAAAVDQFDHYGWDGLLEEVDSETSVTDRNPRGS